VLVEKLAASSLTQETTSLQQDTTVFLQVVCIVLILPVVALAVHQVLDWISAKQSMQNKMPLSNAEMLIQLQSVMSQLHPALHALSSCSILPANELSSSRSIPMAILRGYGSLQAGSGSVALPQGSVADEYVLYHEVGKEPTRVLINKAPRCKYCGNIIDLTKQNCKSCGGNHAR
jgi:hypothetical protein